MSTTLTRLTKVGYKLGRSYLELLERFPLMSIATEEEYDTATGVARDLMGRDKLNKDEARYLDVLATLISAYEDEAYSFDSHEIPPVQVLKFLMEQHAMNVSELGYVIGSQPAASMILAGKREISKGNAKKLATRFKVDAGLFI